MLRRNLFEGNRIAVTEFRCTAAPGEQPFAEEFPAHSISYVRKGSFGCQCRGRFHELVTGSMLVGFPGDEYVCTHDHVVGDECLSFFLAPELVDAIGDERLWRVGAVSPQPELMVLAELALAINLGPARELLIVLSGLLTVASAGAYLVPWLKHMTGDGKGTARSG